MVELESGEKKEKHASLLKKTKESVTEVAINSHIIGSHTQVWWTRSCSDCQSKFLHTWK